jgi:hypothetical protein
VKRFTQLQFNDFNFLFIVPFEQAFTRKFLKYTKIYVQYYLMISYILMIVFLTVRIYEVTAIETRGFIVRVDFWFDIKFTPVYEIINFMQVLGISFLATLNLSTDMTFLTLAFILVEYLKMLEKGFDAAVNDKNLKEFNRFVNAHNKIIDFHKYFKRLLTPQILTSYPLNVFTACFYAYQIVEVRNMKYETRLSKKFQCF